MADWRHPGSGNSAGHQSMNKPVRKALKGNLAFAALDLPLNMAAGDDFGTAALKAGTAAALWYTAPVVMGIHLAATTLPAASAAVHQWHRGKVSGWNSQFQRGTVGGGFQDTQRALTMRQAAVQTIEASKLNARSALGGEARILAQTWTR